MPDDNSCMFTAFGGALGLENPSLTLRRQVAEYILEHPEQYTKAILGDEPWRYRARMLEMDTWGGAIELSILSDIYKVEISSIDVKVFAPPSTPQPLKSLKPPSRPSESTASARTCKTES